MLLVFDMYCWNTDITQMKHTKCRQAFCDLQKCRMPTFLSAGQWLYCIEHYLITEKQKNSMFEDVTVGFRVMWNASFVSSLCWLIRGLTCWSPPTAGSFSAAHGCSQHMQTSYAKREKENGGTDKISKELYQITLLCCCIVYPPLLFANIRRWVLSCPSFCHAVCPHTFFFLCCLSCFSHALWVILHYGPLTEPIRNW